MLYRLIYLLKHLFYVKPKDAYCKLNSITGEGSFFHEEAIVHNTQHKRDQIRIGKHTHIRGELLVFAHSGRISIGDYCYVGVRSMIWSAGSISIGNRVLIAHNVNIHDNNSHPTDAVARHEHNKKIISAGHPSSGLDLKEKPVTIGDDSWVGFNSTIMKGVTIGKGVIIGACSVITEDVPDYAVIVGNPAKIIRYNTPE